MSELHVFTPREWAGLSDTQRKVLAVNRRRQVMSLGMAHESRYHGEEHRRVLALALEEHRRER